MDNIEIIQLKKKLRKRLTEYRYEMINSVVNNHINTIEIAVCLVEYAIQDNRAINEHEKWWFEASYYVDYVLSGSEWEELSDLYSSLVTEVKKRNYFR